MNTRLLQSFEAMLRYTNSRFISNAILSGEIHLFISKFAPRSVDSERSCETFQVSANFGPKPDNLIFLRVGNGSIAYFWGPDMLPASSRVPDCVDYLPSNDDRYISYCNIQTMARYAKFCQFWIILVPSLFCDVQ